MTLIFLTGCTVIRQVWFCCPIGEQFFTINNSSGSILLHIVWVSSLSAYRKTYRKIYMAYMYHRWFLCVRRIPILELNVHSFSFINNFIKKILKLNFVFVRNQHLRQIVSPYSGSQARSHDRSGNNSDLHVKCFYMCSSGNDLVLISSVNC